MPTTLLKYDDEVRQYDVDFSLQPEIASGATIASATVTSSPSGLTVGSPSISGSKVKFQLSSGAPGVTYTIEVLATLNTNYVLEGCVKLYVQEC